MLGTRLHVDFLLLGVHRWLRWFAGTFKRCGVPKYLLLVQPAATFGLYSFVRSFPTSRQDLLLCCRPQLFHSPFQAVDWPELLFPLLFYYFLSILARIAISYYYFRRLRFEKMAGTPKKKKKEKKRCFSLFCIWKKPRRFSISTIFKIPLFLK